MHLKYAYMKFLLHKYMITYIFFMEQPRTEEKQTSLTAAKDRAQLVSCGDVSGACGSPQEPRRRRTRGQQVSATWASTTAAAVLYLIHLFINAWVVW